MSADPGIRDRAASALPPGRFLVLGAASVELARELDLPAMPGLVVVDGALPRGEGLAFVEEIRGDETAGGTPVLVIAAVEDERAALKAGATACLSPGLDPEELGELAGALFADPAATLALHAALARLRAGKLAAAAASLSELAEAAPTAVLTAWCRYLAAQVLEAQGNRQLAVEELDAALADQPSFWRARVRLGHLLGSAGDTEGTPASARLPGKPAAAERTSQAELERLAKPGAPPAGGPSILVADDSDLALAMICETLEAGGFRPRTATDGKTALEMAKEQRPDLLILDGLMPGLSGFEVCKEVKETLYPDNPPSVFILSAIYTKARQRHEAIDLYGADEVVAKPFDDEKFLSLVRKHVGAPAAGAGAGSAHATPPPG